jgi:hypothetical protein
MRRTLFLVGVLFWCVAGLARASIVEIPLPELRGRYYLYDTYQRTAPFGVLPIPAVVHGASLRLVGTLTIRLTYCGIYPSEPYPETFLFQATMPDPTTTGTWGSGFISNADGSFDRTVVFASRGGATWAFLQGGTGEVTLFGEGCPEVDLCWPVTFCSEAFVEDAYLVIDAEFPIPIHESTWGGIKALFEND